MHRKKIKIKSSFDIVFTRIHKTIPCSFDITDKNNIKFVGLQDKQNLCSGFLKLESQPIANAVITFYKPNIKNPNTVDYDTNHYTDGINGVKNWHWNNTFEIHSENIIVDKTVTDENGYYVVFVQNGVYDIKVQYNGRVELLKNQEVTDGIQQEYYYRIDGLIKKKIGSTYIMHDSYARNISLKLLNQYFHKTNGEIVITQKNDLIVYKKINKCDMFALEPGMYDIRIRNNNTQLLYVKDFEFKENSDFIEELVNKLQENFILIEKENNNDGDKKDKNPPPNDNILRSDING